MSIPVSIDPLGTLGNIRWLNYLESDGGRQFVDTGLSRIDDFEIEALFRLVGPASPAPGTTMGDIFGFWGVAGQEGQERLSALLYAGVSFSRWSVDAYISVNAESFVNRDVRWVASARNAIIDGEAYSYVGVPKVTFDLGGNLHIFHRNYADGHLLLTDYKLRIYSLQIRSQGTLIHDYAPALMHGKPCLFDKVVRRALFNATNLGATGEFNYA